MLATEIDLDKIVDRFSLDHRDLLADLLGPDFPGDLPGVTGIHHIAYYIGEYNHSSEVEELVQSLRALDGASHVRSGPSHIAPAQYGVQGFWVNLTYQGRQIELFTCESTKDWTALPPRDRCTLMSHIGFRVQTSHLVLPLVNYLEALHPGTEVIHYEPLDEIGHCYAHLRVTASGAVGEFVYERE